MPVHNVDVAKLLRQIGDLLDIQGANRFRVRAYHTEARNIETMNQDVRDLVEAEEDLTKLPGVGKDIAAKIEQAVKTGKITQLEELKQELPSGLLQLLAIEGLGPKRVKQLYEELDISNWQELKAAAEDSRIRKLEGFGPKIEEKLLKNIKNKSAQEKRTLRFEAEQIIEPLLQYLQELSEVEKVAVAGSYRRKKETVGDVDLLVVSSQGQAVSEKFVNWEDVARIISQGETRSSVVFRTGLQVDLRIVEADSFGAAMQYFTGSRSHNIKLRQIAIDQDCKLNEYGLFSLNEEAQINSSKKEKEEKTAKTEGKKIAGSQEKQIYQKLDLAWIEPELRENKGEIQKAAKKQLPNLIEHSDIKGDLQMHTKQSDGTNTLEEMAQAALKLGYEYIAITDHSQNLKVAHGLDAKRFRQQFAKIDQFNSEHDELLILKAAEVDIMRDGSLDLDDEILEEFDLVVCSIHSHFNLPTQEQTERIVTAMQSSFFHIFGHPTGRLINQREPYEFDWDQVLQAAVDNNCILEINAQPNRLDINDSQARRAKEMGIKISLGTDAHQVNGLHYMKFGVDQARRGWLEADDVLNTYPWPEIEKLLSKK